MHCASTSPARGAGRTERGASMAKRILVIDDDAQIRAVASASLTMVGRWEVLTASSGADGIAQAAAEQPDAILLDVMMPDMDGRATLAVLRSDPATAHIHVIMLSASVGPGGAASVLDLPVTA